MRQLLAALATMAVLALGAAACGDDNNGGGGKSASQALSVTLGADGKLQGVKGVKAGNVRIRFTNQAKQAYDLQLIKVDGNQTVGQVLKIVSGEGDNPIPGWLHGAGGVGSIPPGKSSSATQPLDGGRYYVVAGPDEKGKPVTAPLPVSGGKASGSAPTADAKVTAFEYGFRTENLKSGTQQIQFTNTGAQLHHAVFFPLAQGATVAQAKRFFKDEKGKPPFDPKRQVFNTAVLDTGKSEVLDATLQPGKYALVCFITDRSGGPPHVAKGMITEVNVT